jgi:protein TonB
MSDAALDRGLYFPSPMTNWYRERPFKVAFAVSVVIHAALIAFVPGFRSVPIEAPRELEVQIVPNEAPVIPRVQEIPPVAPKPVQPRIERAPEAVVQPPKPEPVPRPPAPEPAPVPRADIIPAPRAEPKPEFVVPVQEPRPEPKPEAKPEIRPEPKIEPPKTAPVAQAEPRPEPLPSPIVEPRPEPPAAPQPRVEPPAAAPAVVRPQPSHQATVQPPAVVTPPPRAEDESRTRALTDQYRQIISARIKQYEEYPWIAKRRHWEGTTVVQLRFTADGRVEDISVVEKSGHDILDDAAVKMIRSAAPLPIPPEGLRIVLVPIRFRLES